MGLWIRSQSKESLFKCRNICYRKDLEIVSYPDDLNIENYIVLGKYKSKKRALEVLDEIQEALNRGYIEDYSNCTSYAGIILPMKKFIYNMPKK